MAMRGWSASRWRGTHGNHHRTIRLLATQHYLGGVAVSVDGVATVRRDDQGLRRVAGAVSSGGIRRLRHAGGYKSKEAIPVNAFLRNSDFQKLINLHRLAGGKRLIGGDAGKNRTRPIQMAGRPSKNIFLFAGAKKVFQ
jgi:hypothetical protein